MKNRFLNPALYIFTLLAISAPWFLKPGFIFLTDLSWGPKIVVEWFSGTFYIQLLTKTLSFILPVDTIEKLFLVSVMLIVMLGGQRVWRASSRYLFHNSEYSFLGALFALFNPFVYERLMYGQFGIVLSFGFLLFVFSFLIQYLSEKRWKDLLYAGIFTGLTLPTAPHFIFFIITIYIVFLAVLIYQKRVLQNRFISFFLISIALAVLLNANWLTGVLIQKNQSLSFISNSITRDDIQTFQTAGKTSADATLNVIQMSGFWGKDQFRFMDITTTDTWGRSFLILLLPLLGGIYLSFKRSKALTLSLVAAYLLAVILALGVKTGVTREYSLWLFDNLPFYKGLRDSQKWVALIVPIYLFFFSIGFGYVIERYRIFKFPLAVFFAAVIVMNAWPLLWGFAQQAKTGQYPADWYEADELIVADSNCKNKILFLPWHLYMRLSFTNTVVANVSKVFFECQVISGTNQEFGSVYDNSLEPWNKDVAQWIGEKGNDNSLVLKHDVGYIVLAKEVDWQNYTWLDSNKDFVLWQDLLTLRIYKRN